MEKFLFIPPLDESAPPLKARQWTLLFISFVDIGVFAAGVRAGQSVDAMAVVYMVTTLAWLLLALRFVNPTQIVTRAKKS